MTIRSPSLVRVLLVEDDELDRELVRRLLPRGGVDAEIASATNGGDALAAAAQGSFDLVLLDFELPGRDGLFVLRQLRAEHPLLPVVMLTGRDETDLAVDLMRSGAVDYVCKHHLTPQRLAQSIRHALRMRNADIAVRAAEEARAAADEFNRRLLANVQDCVKLLDPEGRLLSINEGGQRALGITDPSECIGQSWIDWWSGNDRAAAAEAVRTAASGRPGRMIGYCPSRSGATLWWDVVITPLPAPSGAIERLIAISRTTHAPEAKEQLEAQVAALRAELHATQVDRAALLARLAQMEASLEQLLTPMAAAG